MGLNEDAEGLLIFDVFAEQITKAVTNRGSRSQMSFKIGPLKNFKIFTGKHLCWSLFFNKVAGLQACNFIKKRLQRKCFPLNIAKSLRTAFKEHLWWILNKNHCIISTSPNKHNNLSPSFDVYSWQRVPNSLLYESPYIIACCPFFTNFVQLLTPLAPSPPPTK